MRDALEGASKFNAAVDAPGDGVFSWITYAVLEDELDRYGIDPGVFQQFVKDEGDSGTYEAEAMVDW